MSQRLTSPPPSPRLRSKRKIVKSQRARELDASILGIDSTHHRMLTPAPSPGASHQDASKQTSPSIAPLQASSQAKVKRATVKHVKKKGNKTSSMRGANLRRHVKIPSADDSRQTPPPAPTQITAALQRELQRRAANYLHYMTIDIYLWPHQRPETLADITATVRQWREKQDLEEASNDIDEDLDDWFVKSGNQAAYSTTHPRFSLQYSIIRSFIKRAKRAYWRGSTWEDFEDNEIAIDSMSEVLKIEDDRLRAIHEKEAVDNNLRLGIFSQIRPRLCFEIWLQDYPISRRPLVMGPSGHIELTASVQRGDGTFEIVPHPKESMAESAGENHQSSRGEPPFGRADHQPGREERQIGKEAHQSGIEDHQSGRRNVKEGTPHAFELPATDVTASQAAETEDRSVLITAPVPGEQPTPLTESSIFTSAAEFSLSFKEGHPRFRQ